MSLFGSKTKSETGAVSLLKEDHEKLKVLFVQFEEAKAAKDKQQIVGEALQTLKVHAQVEEEVFYPAFRETQAAEDETDDLMDEALQEHHVAKFLIGELEDMSPDDEFYDAKFTVLAEGVKHHMEEEESEIFPQIDEDESPWTEVGERMSARREALMRGEKTSSGKSNGKGRAGTARSNGKHYRTASTRKPAAARRK